MLYNDDLLEFIREESNQKIELILSELGILDSCSFGSCEIRSSCPVHHGDNPTAFSYNTFYKCWACYTNGCHKVHGKNANIFGLIKLVLNLSFVESVKWLCNLLEIPLNETSFKQEKSPSPKQTEHLQELRYLQRLQKTHGYTLSRTNEEKGEEVPKPKIRIESVQNSIVLSENFLKQGFSRDVLIRYNVGYCDNSYKPMYKRDFCIVLDEDGQYVEGVTGRTILEKCEFCPYYHEGICPKDNPKVKSYPKWLHHGFKTSEVFYNSWFAKKYVEKSSTAIVVEGPKDVWRLEQFNIHNSLCLFGLNLMPYHLKKLLEWGCNKLIIALNNDEAGQSSVESIQKEYGDYFKIINPVNLLGCYNDFCEIPLDDMEKTAELLGNL